MRASLIAAALLIIASGAYAQSLNVPTYSVGDNWTIKTGNSTRTVKVLKVGDDGAIDMLALLPGCPICIFQLDRTLRILTILDGAGKPAEPTQFTFIPLGAQWHFYDFPLEPKKHWAFSAVGFLRGQSENYEVDNRVDRIEDVKTQAGTFTAYRIVREWVLKGGRAQVRHSDFRWQTTTWFAPDVKFAVKTTTTNPRGENSELISYSVK
ncbi:MAG: hypothetical protein ACREK6_03515 [Candidatus Rokuibacteriota bacterium]